MMRFDQTWYFQLFSESYKDSPFFLKSFCLLEPLICFMVLFCSHNKTDTLYLPNNLFKSFLFYLFLFIMHE